MFQRLLFRAIVICLGVSLPTFACGGMVFPSSLLCSPSTGGGLGSYPSLTMVMYVPTRLLGGNSSPISYPPQLGGKVTGPSYNVGYPGYGMTYPSSYYPSYSSYYPSYYPSYGLGGGFTSGLGGGCGSSLLSSLTGYGSSCGSSLLPSLFSGYGSYGLGGLPTSSVCGGGGLYGLPTSSCGYSSLPVGGYTGGYGYPGYGGGLVTIQPAPVGSVLPPNPVCATPTHTGYTSGMIAPRVVCVQCGLARNLLRPISRAKTLSSNRFY